MYPVVTLGAPALTSDTTAVVYSKMPLLQARFYTNDSTLDSTSLVVVVGSDTVTNLTAPHSGDDGVGSGLAAPAQLRRAQEVFRAYLPHQW